MQWRRLLILFLMVSFGIFNAMDKPHILKFNKYSLSDPSETDQQHPHAIAQQQYEQRSKLTFTLVEDENQLKKAHDFIFGTQPDYNQAKEILNHLSRHSSNNHTKSQAAFLRGILEFNGLGGEVDLENAKYNFLRIIKQYPDELSLQQPAQDFLLITRALIKFRNYIARSSSLPQAFRSAQILITEIPEHLVNQALIEKITTIIQSQYPHFNPLDPRISLKRIRPSYSRQPNTAGQLLSEISEELETYQALRTTPSSESESQPLSRAQQIQQSTSEAYQASQKPTFSIKRSKRKIDDVDTKAPSPQTPSSLEKNLTESESQPLSRAQEVQQSTAETYQASLTPISLKKQEFNLSLDYDPNKEYEPSAIKNDYMAEYDWLKKVASENPDPERKAYAQYRLGNVFFFGITPGFKYNLDRALQHYQKAAELSQSYIRAKALRKIDEITQMRLKKQMYHE